MAQDHFQKLAENLNQVTLRLQNSLSDPDRMLDLPGLLKRRGSLVIGPRGVGKTTFLLKQMPENSFYISLDNPLLAEVNFFEFADFLLQLGYSYLILDEVHYLSNWSVQLKALYDAHPGKKIIATDSSTLILRQGLGDLSRRFVIEKIPYLSFHEFLYLKHQLKLPQFSWEELPTGNVSKFQKALKLGNVNIQKEFRDYLAAGTRPYFLEEAVKGDYRQKTLNLLEKIIHSDIPYFLPEVKERHLQLMKNVIGHLALSPIPTLNIESLAKTWSVAKMTVYNLLEVMEQSGLIRMIAQEGKRGSGKGKKIFFSDPTFYSCLEGELGNVRESYFAMVMDYLGKKVQCPKEDSKCDFIVDGLSFEIGGKSKKRKMADLVLRDNIDTATPGVVPLWALGFLVRR